MSQLHVVNQTVWEDEWLIPLLEFGCAGIHMPPIIARNIPKEMAGHWLLSEYRRTFANRSMIRRPCAGKTIWIGSYRTQRTAHRVEIYIDPDENCRSSWIVEVAAHEARHVWQKGTNWGLSGRIHSDDVETDAEQYASRRLHEWFHRA